MHLTLKHPITLPAPPSPVTPSRFHRGVLEDAQTILGLFSWIVTALFLSCIWLSLGSQSKARRCFLPCFGLGNISKRTQKGLSVIIPASTAFLHRRLAEGNISPASREKRGRTGRQGFASHISVPPTRPHSKSLRPSPPVHMSRTPKARTERKEDALTQEKQW